MSEDFLDGTLRGLRQLAATQRQEALRALEQRGEADVLRFADYARRLDRGVCLELCSTLAGTRAGPLADLVGYFARQTEPALRAEAWHALERMQPGVRVPALTRLLSADDAAVREKACYLLGRSGNQGPRDGLVRLLQDSTPQVVVAALEALYLLRLPETQSEVIRLLQAPSGEVRSKALEVLVHFAPQEALPTGLAVSLLETDPSPAVRLAALWALGACPSSEGRAALLRALDQGVPETEAAAASALGHHNHPEAARALTAKVIRGGPSGVALQCERALRALPENLVRDACAAFLDGSDPAGRMNVAALMGTLAQPEFGRLLIARLATEPEPPVRAALIEALGRGGWDEAWPVLRGGLTADGPASMPAVEALGRLLRESRLEDFCQLLGQFRDPGLLNAVLSRLNAYGKGHVLPPALAEGLRPLFSSSGASTAVLAIETASRLPGAELVPALLELATTTAQEHLHRAAGRAVLKMCEGQFVSLLEKATPEYLEAFARILRQQTGLAEEGPELCRRLAALSAQGTPGATHALLEAATVEPASLVRALGQVVAAQGETEAGVLLETWSQMRGASPDGVAPDWPALLSAGSARVRAAALKALAPRDGDDLLPLLVDIAISDSNETVRTEAHQAVKRTVEVAGVALRRLRSGTGRDTEVLGASGPGGPVPPPGGDRHPGL